MIGEKMRQVLRDEGVASIMSQGIRPHLVNTWNSYIEIIEDKYLLIPASRMKTTEENIKVNRQVLMTVGSRQVDGFHSKGTGFLIEGQGEFLYEGERFDLMKERFPWMRAVLQIKVDKSTQTL